MNYLVLENNGLIEIEDLILIGSSTKRGDHSKIGQFGSGWKYALAWILRNYLTIRIFSGEDEIVITSTVKLHRNKPVKVITVNGMETSLTTHLGPKWTGWMALREIISNAMDEGGFKTSTVWNPSEFVGTQGKTMIYVEMNNDLAQVLSNYNNYFAFERTPNIETTKGRIFFKEHLSTMIIYRKGIRCIDSTRQSTIDFDLNEITINESRLAAESSMDTRVSELINTGEFSIFFLERLLREPYRDWLPKHSPSEALIAMLIELVESGVGVTSESMRGLGGVLLCKSTDLVLPNHWYNILEERGYVQSPFEKFRDSGTPSDFIRVHENIDEIKYHLSGLKLDDIEIITGTWNDYSHSNTFYAEGKAYLKTGLQGNNSAKVLAALILKTLPVNILENVFV